RGVLWQVHAVPDRRGPRRRGHRPDPRRQRPRGPCGERRPARGPLRAHDRGVAVRDGRPHADARPQRAPVLRRGPRRTWASRRGPRHDRRGRARHREAAVTLLQEADYGTPARPGPATVEVEVDGRPVTVPEGTSVMRAAALAGVDVPKLCATDTLA